MWQVISEYVSPTCLNSSSFQCSLLVFLFRLSVPVVWLQMLREWRKWLNWVDMRGAAQQQIIDVSCRVSLMLISSPCKNKLYSLLDNQLPPPLTSPSPSKLFLVKRLSRTISTTKIISLLSNIETFNALLIRQHPGVVRRIIKYHLMTFKCRQTLSLANPFGNDRKSSDDIRMSSYDLRNVAMRFHMATFDKCITLFNVARLSIWS